MNPDRNPQLSADAAKEKLHNRGIPFSEEYFLRYIRSGNMDVITLYLDAGISPNATIDGESALAVSVNYGHKPLTKMLLDAGAEPMGILEGLEMGKPSRDNWDRLSSLSGVFTFISSLLIAIVGWYFTNSYNERQLKWEQTQARQEQATKVHQNKLAEMQTVEKMIPHLTKNESSKQVALIAISALASPEIAAQIAAAYGGQGSINALAQLAVADTEKAAAPAISALTHIASREPNSSGKPAHQALANILEVRERAIVKIIRSKRAICNGFVVDGKRGWIVTANYCVNQSIGGAISVQFGENPPMPISKQQTGLQGLLAFLKIDADSLPALKLSDKQFIAGSSISKTAFNLGASLKDRNKLRVVIGKVIEAGEMKFPGPEGAGIKVDGLNVLIDSPAKSQDRIHGSGGGPLLDSEGNVACMTFSSTFGTEKKQEQCISARSISKAFRTVSG